MSTANVIFAISSAAAIAFLLGFLLALWLTSGIAKSAAEMHCKLSELCDRAEDFMRRKHGDGGIWSGLTLSDCIKSSRELLNK